MVGIIISILDLETLRHREVKPFVQGHTVKSVLEHGPQSRELISRTNASLSTKLSPLRIFHSTLQFTFPRNKKMYIFFFLP